MSVVELAKPPSLRGLYRRAALGLLARRSGTGLPDTTVILRDVGVERDRLARYAKLCGFRLSDTLPSPYPQVLAFPLAVALMAERDFPFPVIGVVHLANRMEVLRPIDAGERLELTVRAADLRDHERGRAFDIRATASVGDEVVWRAISTYLRKEKPGRGARETAEPPDGGALWQVGRSVGTDYAKVSGDHNPIHTSLLAARAFGYKRPIAHGMWSAARCLAALEGRLPTSYAFDVTFRRPLVLPARVRFLARQGERWELSLHDAKTGAPHLTATVT